MSLSGYLFVNLYLMPLVSFYTPKTSETWKLILTHLMYYSIIVFREKGNSFSTHSPGMFLYFSMASQVCFLFQHGSPGIFLYINMALHVVPMKSSIIPLRVATE